MLEISALARWQRQKYPNLPIRDFYTLLSFITGWDKSFLLAHPEAKLEKNQLRRLKWYTAKLNAGYPLAYISKEDWFYGRPFRVNRKTLIPRPETELLIDMALSAIYVRSYANIVDIGTGSGCIITTLAAELEKKGLADNFRCYAVDVSRPALRLAAYNADTHKVRSRIIFRQGDLLSPLLPDIGIRTIAGKWLLIANLPYLTPAQIRHSPTIRHEPRLALNGGADGWQCYRKLLKQLKNTKKSFPDFAFSSLWEIDDTQADAAATLIQSYFPLAKVLIKKDSSSYPRAVFFSV